MTKKIFGFLSVLMVIFMVVIFFFPPDKKANETQEISEKTTIKKTNDVKQTYKNLPDVSRDDWQLLLVNSQHPIKEDMSHLTPMKNGYQIDQRVYDFYYKLEEDAAAAGFSLVTISAFRSIEDQQEVYDSGIQEHLVSGLSEAAAEEKTKEYITFPGTSEHHTGLAVDVVDQEWYNQGNGLEEEFCETAAGKWLDQHAATYGFIIRYPKNKTQITGINYEPWHLRYVGRENAEFMVKHQLVLEEYLEVLKEAGK